MNEAPLFVRAYDLHSWLLDRLDSPRDARPETAHGLGGEVALSVLRHSRELLNAVSLVVARFDLEARLVEADEHATLLRVHLRLASEKKLLSDRQLLYANGELADIGRQIGGWRRHLGVVE